ncbi:cupin domain-containing protein [Demequina sp. NBRC 110055]|uniref:cupin domain-containing protein n=1 Tax=Demequina sp. NBRC 110055 TaxID=1570344 RepID=UPI000A02D011|nr:cupin domain-containing protein [Demequina sp. NBRC 110055]
MFTVTDLSEAIDEHLALAYEASSGRSSVTVTGDRHSDLRQTLIAIAGGNRLHDHDSPGEATLQVLRGEITLTVGEGQMALGEGELMVLPAARHGVEAVTDCALLLTVATRAER